jgi:hypothetical protein
MQSFQESQGKPIPGVGVTEFYEKFGYWARAEKKGIGGA